MHTNSPVLSFEFEATPPWFEKDSVYWVVVVWSKWECKFCSFANAFCSWYEHFSSHHSYFRLNLGYYLLPYKRIIEKRLDLNQHRTCHLVALFNLFFKSSHLAFNLGYKCEQRSAALILELSQSLYFAILIFEHRLQILKVSLINEHQVFKPNHKLAGFFC